MTVGGRTSAYVEELQKLPKGVPVEGKGRGKGTTGGTAKGGKGKGKQKAKQVRSSGSRVLGVDVRQLIHTSSWD